MAMMDNDPVLRAPDRDWRDDPARPCLATGPADFYAEDDLGQARAKAACRACPVQMECLDHAVIAEELGVWGGTNEAERRRIARRVHGTAARYRSRCRCDDCAEAYDRRRDTTRELERLLSTRVSR